MPNQLILSFIREIPFAIEDQSDLQEAEDVIARTYIPVPNVSDYDLMLSMQSWSHRPDLADQLVDNRFLGRLGNIVLEKMQDPYEAILEEERFKVSPRRAFVENGIGFVVTASLISRSLGDLGQMIRPIWLVPKTERNVHNGPWRRQESTFEKSAWCPGGRVR